ncbi:type VI secretion system accessory protein TagJ [Desulfosarcina sp.]|uniref:type VI secretion system accessory protein TagJ n=1 Tax=Desulfosarcina sp. TaxID=2027861 RepID=UPI00397098EB
MNAKALILDGQISAARAMLVDRVKKRPADIQARSLLFQVMLLCGEWDKAHRQLDIAANQLASPETNVPVYRDLIQAEKERVAVSKMQQRPTFFPGIPEYCEDFFQALNHLEEGKIDAAANLFGRIDAGLPDVQGTLNGQPFKGFRETDTTLTYFIEAIEYERYLWVPIADIREIAVSPPQNLIDLIWVKGRITTWEGLTMGCFLPVLYPNSSASDDDRIRLGRLTDWKPLGGPYAKAVGQHVYEVGGADRSIFELTEVVFTLADAADSQKGESRDRS